MSTPNPAATPAAPSMLQTDVLALASLSPSKLNPRKRFDDLDGLAASIKASGIIDPLIIRKTEIVDGERRWRAAKLAGVMLAPVIRRDDLTDAEVLELQMVTAVQRADLTPLEEGRGFRAMIKASPATVSAATIAARVGRPEREVVERMRLLELTPDLQALLEQGRISVGLANVLSRLTPADQRRASSGGDTTKRWDRKVGGLWQNEGATLFDDEPDGEKAARDPYRGLKPATVRELEAWIAKHVRFDPAQAGTAAPLDFGQTLQRVTMAASLRTGRGPSHVEITHDQHLGDDVRDPKRRVYGPASWKRADGTTVRPPIGKPYTAAPCTSAILGVVTVGREYGQAFNVCIAKDTCATHWGSEIRARQKAAKLRASGQGGKANDQAAKRRAADAAREAKATAQRKADYAAFKRARPLIVEALRKVLPTTLDDPKVVGFLWDVVIEPNGRRAAPTVSEAAAAIVLSYVPEDDGNDYRARWHIDDATKVAKHFGVDARKIVDAQRAAIAAEAKATAAADKAKAKAAAKGATGNKATKAARKGGRQ